MKNEMILPFGIGQTVTHKHSGLAGEIVQINIRSEDYVEYLIECFDGAEIKTYWFHGWQLEDVDA